MDPRNGEGEAQSTNAADQSLADSTRDEADAQNNAVNGTNATDEVALSKSNSKASSTRNSTPVSTSTDIRNSAQDSKHASADQDALQDSKDASNDTPNPAQASSKDSEENGAAPYGTRSRNRPGRSRPNYAEDTEMEFEMTAASASANGNISDPPSRNSAPVEGGPSSGVGGKKGSGPAQGNASWGNSGSNSKDNPANPNISGASAVATATPPSTAQPPVKRRKNAAATNGNNASAAAPSQPGAKRGNHVMVAANSARESNMLTFENTGAILKDGRMVADDGQTVSINGKF
jgi:hypothetical protein